ncbi:toxin-antitoxin system YwqK family antitoxin [Stutzerimonas nitrititolerans]|uniref:toxin-antitoxin system YwqK family antitoxin n=1 Tax=Stutzerimonas nitrititolerans TaxID=2482751 RepID=UPI000EEACD6E|nr:hypothetical protein [Stutzerimonas nitrititolerans]HCL78144.1 hypothetical protein [Pseudomonas sp.]
MKRAIALLLTVTVLAGCKAEIDHAETVTRNGLIYKYGDTDPFSGLVLNIPAGLPGVSALCNSLIEKGRQNGKSECFYNEQKVYEVEYLAGRKNGEERVLDSKTGEKVSIKSWKNGYQDGLEERYWKGNIVHKVEYKNGKRDGEEIRWSDDGTTILAKLTWLAGNKQDGFEEDYNGKSSYLNGKLHGVQVKYIRPIGTKKKYISSEVKYDNGTAISGWFRDINRIDGTLTQEFKLVQSARAGDESFWSKYPGKLVPEGLVFNYDSQTGKLIGEEFWSNGVQIKHTSIYGVHDDEELSYNILDTAAPYERYKKVSKAEYMAYGTSTATTPSSINADPSSVATKDNCLDAWIAAYRKEVGDEAMIVSGQIDEWNQWCDEGQLP